MAMTHADKAGRAGHYRRERALAALEGALRAVGHAPTLHAFHKSLAASEQDCTRSEMATAFRLASEALTACAQSNDLGVKSSG